MSRLAVLSYRLRLLTEYFPSQFIGRHTIREAPHGKLPYLFTLVPEWMPPDTVFRTLVLAVGFEPTLSPARNGVPYPLDHASKFWCRFLLNPGKVISVRPLPLPHSPTFWDVRTVTRINRPDINRFSHDFRFLSSIKKGVSCGFPLLTPLRDVRCSRKVKTERYPSGSTSRYTRLFYPAVG